MKINIEEIVRNNFRFGFNGLAQAAHANARQKGFYDDPPRALERLMQITTEIAEAAEATRHGNPPDDHIPEFSNLEAELADAVIRIMDFAAGQRLRLAEAILAKMDYNASRPRMHGGKLK